MLACRRRGFEVTKSPATAALSVAGLLPTISVPPPDGAFAYYIGPNGSDSNAGTFEAPWALTALNNASKRLLYAGRTVGLLDGTYNVKSLFGTVSGQSASIDLANWVRVASGSAGNPTTIKAVNARQARIFGDKGNFTSSNERQAGGIGAENASYIVLDGLQIDGFNHVESNFYNCHHITIQNCNYPDHDYSANEGNTNSAVVKFIGNCHHNLVTNCRLTNFSASANSQRTAGVMGLNEGSNNFSDTVISFCTIIGAATTGSNSNGYHLKNAGGSNNSLLNCYIEMPGGNPVLWRGNNSATNPIETMQNCILVGRGDLGAFASEGADADTTRNIINNTIVGGPTVNTAIRLDGSTAGTDGGTVNSYNNLIYATTTNQYGYMRAQTLGLLGICDYNYYGDGSPFSITAGAGPTNYTSLATWRTASGKDAGSISSATPGFTSTGSEAALYQLASDSVCKNAGRSNGLSGGAVCDIGAWGGATPPTQIGASF